MVVFIFEDKEGVACSKLLRENILDVRFVFADGFKNLPNCIEGVLNNRNFVFNKETDVIITYIDALHDNTSGVGMYLKIKRKFADIIYKTLYIIPIPCMEYVILDALIQCYNFDFENALFKFNDYSIDIDDEMYLFDLADSAFRRFTKNYEKKFKKILQLSTRKCMYNIIVKDEEYSDRYKNEGMFYCIGCDTCEEDCKNRGKYTLKHKAYNIYARLPVWFTKDSNKEYKKILGTGVSIELEDALRKQDLFYKRIYTKYNSEKVFTICKSDA